MNRLLLELFVNSVRDRLLGRHIGEIRWHRPVLSLQIKTGQSWSFLVVILETPGPFCFLSGENPLNFPFISHFSPEVMISLVPDFASLGFRMNVKAQRPRLAASAAAPC